VRGVGLVLHIAGQRRRDTAGVDDLANQHVEFALAARRDDNLGAFQSE
jgi:hypothetical protein